MRLWDPKKLRDPTPKEQANWEVLFNAEKQKQKQKRQEEDRKFNREQAERRRLEQFRY
ncbi:MAG: hypothetical protein ACT4OM_03110 [Actinomycetota bacterium]